MDKEKHSFEQLEKDEQYRKELEAYINANSFDIVPMIERYTPRRSFEDNSHYRVHTSITEGISFYVRKLKGETLEKKEEERLRYFLSMKSGKISNGKGGTYTAFNDTLLGELTHTFGVNYGKLLMSSDNGAKSLIHFFKTQDIYMRHFITNLIETDSDDQLSKFKTDIKKIDSLNKLEILEKVINELQLEKHFNLEEDSDQKKSNKLIEIMEYIITQKKTLDVNK